MQRSSRKTGREPPPGGDFLLDLDGYRGADRRAAALAREQKVDLAKISILALADQYLAFIARARQLRLEIAADYLVMAAWLAYLKSRLLLPEPPGRCRADAAPSWRRRSPSSCSACRRCRRPAQKLMALPQLGRDFFARGEPERLRIVRSPVYGAKLYELLQRLCARMRGRARRAAAPHPADRSLLDGRCA